MNRAFGSSLGILILLVAVGPIAAQTDASNRRIRITGHWHQDGQRRAMSMDFTSAYTAVSGSMDLRNEPADGDKGGAPGCHLSWTVAGNQAPMNVPQPGTATPQKIHVITADCTRADTSTVGKLSLTLHKANLPGVYKVMGTYTGAGGHPKRILARAQVTPPYAGE